MGCNCGGKITSGREQFVYRGTDGATRVVNSEIEAKALVGRKGGSYTKK